MSTLRFSLLFVRMPRGAMARAQGLRYGSLYLCYQPGHF